MNADDFGLSRGVNVGVIRAHEEGIVRSAGLMVRGRGARDAAAYARQTPSLSLGLHVDLGEWVYKEGRWEARYDLAASDGGAAAEARAQLELFRLLMERDPTHLDSHQHLHLGPEATEALAAIGRELGVPVRHLSESVTYVGNFYGQSGTGGTNYYAIGVRNLVRMIRRLPAGITEMSCHPAATIDFDDVYADERLIELETLCAPEVRAAIEEEEVVLGSFTNPL